MPGRMSHAALFQRYTGGMATIQIREIPHDAYETIRRRAQEAGQSIQSYMRDQVVEFASRRTKEEAWAAVDSAIVADDSPGGTLDSIIGALAEDRR